MSVAVFLMSLFLNSTDYPLDEQHGGKLDVILHKLTEDILCLSQLSQTDPRVKQKLLNEQDTTIMPSLEDRAIGLDSDCDEDNTLAVQRVLRISDFNRKNPECCLVDDPFRVLTVMSRADIADTLQYCLQHVTSRSGIPVGTPRYAVVAPPYSTIATTPLLDSRSYPICLDSFDHTAEEIDDNWLQEKSSGMSYPIIVKPLTAAGTKASHAMAVVMDPSLLGTIVREKAPCLLQEYSNHDAVLYKVYVLGDHVSVHKRRSLPNLPNKALYQSQLRHVEFDSQKPYPRLIDFGYPDEVMHDNTSFTTTSTVESGATTSQTKKRFRWQKVPQYTGDHSDSHVVTVDEVMPIVCSLKKAFGLELFGFDVIITNDLDDSIPLNYSNINQDENDDDKEASVTYAKSTVATGKEKKNGCHGRSSKNKMRMLVIDVNYFPSYKEVSNFPALLAKYLTVRVIQSRRKSKYKVADS